MIRKKPEQVTLGMRSRPYWKELKDLCERYHRKPAEIIHRVLDRHMEEELELLRKEIEAVEKVRAEARKKS